MDREEKEEYLKEMADEWAKDLLYRFEALHNNGFADELAIELLKIYVAKE